jgi:hypothetical protein
MSALGVLGLRLSMIGQAMQRMLFGIWQLVCEKAGIAWRFLRKWR